MSSPSIGDARCISELDASSNKGPDVERLGPEQKMRISVAKLKPDYLQRCDENRREYLKHLTLKEEINSQILAREIGTQKVPRLFTPTHRPGVL